MTGHTHEDIDQKFSLVSEGIRKDNVRCLSGIYIHNYQSVHSGPVGRFRAYVNKQLKGSKTMYVNVLKIFLLPRVNHIIMSKVNYNSM